MYGKALVRTAQSLSIVKQVRTRKYESLDTAKEGSDQVPRGEGSEEPTPVGFGENPEKDSTNART